MSRLYCVGCDSFLFDTERMTGPVAITCRCGADAPVCYDRETCEVASFPFSLLGGDNLPHLEYYLGFSEHESVIKAIVREVLAESALISMAECDLENCQEHYSIQRERAARRIAEALP